MKHPLMKNALLSIVAIIAGWIIGSFVNMQLVKLGYHFFPMDGVNVNDMKALKEAFSTADYTHFIFPFLAHALGTLVGAFIAAFIAPFHNMKFAYSIGGLFFVGGVIACFIIPAPIWFIVLDLIVAYIPMAFLGGKIALSLRKK